MSPPWQNPQQGEIHYIHLNPTKGYEIRKTRPALVISSDDAGILPIRLVVPITGWNASYEGKFWLVPVQPTSRNGLKKSSAIDVMQTRAVSVSPERFAAKLGNVEAETLEQVKAALCLVIDV